MVVSVGLCQPALGQALQPVIRAGQHQSILGGGNIHTVKIAAAQHLDAGGGATARIDQRLAQPYAIGRRRQRAGFGGGSLNFSPGSCTTSLISPKA